LDDSLKSRRPDRLNSTLHGHPKVDLIVVDLLSLPLLLSLLGFLLLLLLLLPFRVVFDLPGYALGAAASVEELLG